MTNAEKIQRWISLSDYDMENPNKGWKIICEEQQKSPPKIVQYELNFE